MLGIAILILFSIFLLIHWKIDKYILEWIIFYYLHLLLWLTENWKWCMFVIAWILLWVYLFLNAGSRFQY